jgi:hypothetical protein
MSSSLSSISGSSPSSLFLAFTCFSLTPQFRCLLRESPFYGVYVPQVQIPGIYQRVKHTPFSADEKENDLHHGVWKHPEGETLFRPLPGIVGPFKYSVEFIHVEVDVINNYSSLMLGLKPSRCFNLTFLPRLVSSLFGAGEATQFGQETFTKDGPQMPTIVLDSGALAENGVKGGDLGGGRAGPTLLGGFGGGRAAESVGEVVASKQQQQQQRQIQQKTQQKKGIRGGNRRTRCCSTTANVGTSFHSDSSCNSRVQSTFQAECSPQADALVYDMKHNWVPSLSDGREFFHYSTKASDLHSVNDGKDFLSVEKISWTISLFALPTSSCATS